MDLSRSETIVVGTLLNDWPAEMPPCLKELVIRAPACFSTPAGKVLSVLRELHYQDKPSHSDAVLEICINKGIIDPLMISWWGHLITSSLILEQAELEAKEILEVHTTAEFSRALLEIGQRVTDDPSTVSGGRKVLRGLLEQFDQSPLSRNGNGHATYEDMVMSQFLAYVEPEGSHLLLPRYVTHGEITVIAGVGGLGKSRLIFQLATSQILSRQWCGLSTGGVPKTWQFFSNENSKGRWKLDFERISKALTPEEAALIDKHLFIDTSSDPFISLDDPESVHLLEEGLKLRRPDVVVFDPFINYVRSNINDPTDIRNTVRDLTRLVRKYSPQAAIIIIHHARPGRINAASAIDIFDSANFGLGAKALYSCARTYMNLIPASSENRDELALACAKANNCPHFETRGVRFNEESGLYEVNEDFDLQELKDDITGKSTGRSCPINLILGAIRENHRRTSEIIEFLDHCSKRSVERAITEAAEKRYIEKVGRGQWMLGPRARNLTNNHNV